MRAGRVVAGDSHVYNRALRRILGVLAVGVATVVVIVGWQPSPSGIRATALLQLRSERVFVLTTARPLHALRIPAGGRRTVVVRYAVDHCLHRDPGSYEMVTSVRLHFEYAGVLARDQEVALPVAVQGRCGPVDRATLARELIS